MNLNDYSYHNYPSSLVRKYKIYTLEDNNQGIDKYVFNLQQSYVHNFLDKRRFERINLIQIAHTSIDEESKRKKKYYLQSQNQIKRKLLKQCIQ